MLQVNEQWGGSALMCCRPPPCQPLKSKILWNSLNHKDAGTQLGEPIIVSGEFLISS